MSNIADIVDVTIDIESPSTSVDSFNKILLIVPAPTAAGTSEMPEIAIITSASDLLAFGYGSTDAAYIAASKAFAQNPGPNNLYVIARESDYDDEEVLTDEEIADTLARAMQKDEWYGFAIAGYTSAADILAAANWAEANKKLFAFDWSGTDCPISVDGKDYTIAFFREGGETDYAGICFMAKCFSYDPGSETWGLKSLNTLAGDDLSSTKTAELKGIPSNFYHKIANRAVVQEGKVGSGEWIDIIRFKDWLLSRVQNEVFSYLVSNVKVPYNDAGITGVSNVIESVLAEAQLTGGIDDDRFDGEGNMDPGYTVTVPKSADISSTDKKARRLNNVYFTARLAGAVHYVNIRGKLVY